MKVRLYINHYKDKNPERNKELQTCLKRNEKNPFIDEIIKIEKRLMYYEFFRLMEDGYVNILANSDIYFDETIELVKDWRWTTGTAFALSRYDEDINESLKLFDRNDSQDAWIFYGSPAKMFESNRGSGDYTLGIAGCDNAIAHELISTGFAVYNPAHSIRAIHLHNSNIRNYIKDGEVKRLQREYARVPLININQVPTI